MTILNVLNGQMMYDYFKKNKLDNNGVYVPFNEAMCVGQHVGDIFSTVFNAARCQTHGVDIQDYQAKVLQPLEPLFNAKFSQISLWFDEDMFCQINLLTLLAYLEQQGYQHKIVVHLVTKQFQLIKEYQLAKRDFNKIYQQVILKHNVVHLVDLPFLEKGIQLYLDYRQPNNQITQYIKQHKQLDENVLLHQLFEKFEEYGLGDLQYQQLIKQQQKT